MTKFEKQIWAAAFAKLTLKNLETERESGSEHKENPVWLAGECDEVVREFRSLEHLRRAKDLLMNTEEDND